MSDIVYCQSCGKGTSDAQFTCEHCGEILNIWSELFHCDRCGKEMKRYGKGRCRKCLKLPIDVSPYLEEKLQKYSMRGTTNDIWLHQWFDGKKWVTIPWRGFATKKAAEYTLWQLWPDVRGISYPNDEYNQKVAAKYIPSWFKKLFRVRRYRITNEV